MKSKWLTWYLIPLILFFVCAVGLLASQNTCGPKPEFPFKEIVE